MDEGTWEKLWDISVLPKIDSLELQHHWRFNNVWSFLSPLTFSSNIQTFSPAMFVDPGVFVRRLAVRVLFFLEWLVENPVDLGNNLDHNNEHGAECWVTLTNWTVYSSMSCCQFTHATKLALTSAAVYPLKMFVFNTYLSPLTLKWVVNAFIFQPECFGHRPIPTTTR